MDVYQVGLQLESAGLVVSVGYKLALVRIRSWREAEKERTKAIGDQLAAIVASVNTHAQADMLATARSPTVSRDSSPARRPVSAATKADNSAANFGAVYVFE